MKNTARDASGREFNWGCIKSMAKVEANKDLMGYLVPEVVESIE